MLKQILAFGLVIGFALPAGAVGSKHLYSDGLSTPSVVFQQQTCKEGEVWDETEKKCVKKEG